MSKINKKQLEQVIINIIQDAIIYNRFYEGMDTILNAFKPSESSKGLDVGFIGSDNAIKLMGVKEGDLADRLETIFYNIGCTSENAELSVPELAKNIYVEWLCEIRNYCLTSKIA